MVHASELIRQIIRAHNLGQIYPGKDESSIGDLFQVAWIQIESALYKYEARPHCASCYNQLRPGDSMLCSDFLFAGELISGTRSCPHCGVKLVKPEYDDSGEVVEAGNIYYRGKSKLFNLWSQIARTVILAHIKKENRDRKNGPMLKEHVGNRVTGRQDVFSRFVSEARDIFKHNREHVRVLDAMEELYREDDKPHEGFIGKLVERSGLPRHVVNSVLGMIRLRSHEFTDSPLNEKHETIGHRMRADDDTGRSD